MRRNLVFHREVLGAAILHVRSGQAVSRTTLAKKLGISPSTTGLYVDQLIADGYLSESGLNQGAMGRPQRILQTQAAAGGSFRSLRPPGIATPRGTAPTAAGSLPRRSICR